MSTPELDMDKIRAAMEARASAAPPAPGPTAWSGAFPELDAVDATDISIPGPGGDVPARLYRMSSLPVRAALVWAHGGGFAAGDLEMAEAHWVSLSLAAEGIAVLSLDYRKAGGGVHFPAPSDDVLAGWLWAVEHRADLGGGALHLGGASAGASLVAGVAKRLRDGAGEPPASLVLVYPTLHPDLPPASNELAAVTAHLWEKAPPQIFQFMSLNYVGTPDALEDPYAFPGLGDLDGLPPVYVLNSEVDLLRASGEAFAAGLHAVGADVTVELEPGAGHGHLNEPLLEVAPRSLERLVDWLTAAG